MRWCVVRTAASSVSHTVAARKLVDKSADQTDGIPVAETVAADRRRRIPLRSPWDGRGIAINGKPHENTYALVMQMRDGKVVDMTALTEHSLNELMERVQPPRTWIHNPAPLARPPVAPVHAVWRELPLARRGEFVTVLTVSNDLRSRVVAPPPQPETPTPR